MAATPIRVVVTLWFAAMAMLAFVFSFGLQIVATIVTYPFVNKLNRRWINGHIFRKLSWFFIVSKLNPFWSIRRIGPLPKTAPANAIVMSNHLSNADPFVLCNILFPWETKYISKSSLFNLPFGGWCMSLAGDLPIYFTKDKDGWGIKKGTLAPVMELAKSYVQNGLYMAAFPEGVRSATGQLQELKDGMFKLAIDAECAIIPVALAGTNRGWPMREILMDTATMVGSVGEPISPKGLTCDELKARVRAAILELQAKLPSVPQPKFYPVKEKKPKVISEASTTSSSSISSASDGTSSSSSAAGMDGDKPKSA